MLSLLRDLVQHKWYANAALLNAIRRHPAVAEDEELRRLLRHILVANRFWLSLSMGREFSIEAESRVPTSLEAVSAQYENTQSQELDWISIIQESDLTRTLETSYMPGQSFSVAEGIMQVCLHSHGHRAQCASRLRLLGGTPPMMDFVAWLKERPAASWQMNE